MRKLLGCLIFFFPFIVTAKVTSNDCVVVDKALEIAVRQEMEEELNITDRDLVLQKTKIELLENELVAPKMAELLAKRSVKKGRFQNVESIIDIYEQYHPRNLVYKVTYFNHQNQQNVYIGSSIVNDDECTVSFVGYLPVKIEF